MSNFEKASSRVLLALLAGAALYAALAYGFAPWAWRHHEHQAGLAGKAMVATTKLGNPGDAINVGLEGNREDILCAMAQAGWRAADPVTLGTSVEIAESVLARRAYDTAPVSALYYDGRRQDLAFEKSSGKSPRTRHHVRFWKALDSGDDGLPVWLGAATFDRSVGLSHYTGQVTHHIAPDIDVERDLLASDLAATATSNRPIRSAESARRGLRAMAAAIAILPTARFWFQSCGRVARLDPSRRRRFRVRRG